MAPFWFTIIISVIGFLAYSIYLIVQTSGEIEEVKYIGPGRTKTKPAGLKGAAIGGLLYGPLGAVAGSLVPTDGKQKLEFEVRYKNGFVITEEVEPYSERFYELLEYIKE